MSFPKSWTLGIGDDLFRLVRGVSYEKPDASGTPGKGLVPILRANNICGGQIADEDLVYVPARYVGADQYLKPFDLLIAASSGSRSVVGKAAKVGNEHTRFGFGAFCCVARPRNPEFGNWFGAFSKSTAYREFVESVALGININNLRSSDLQRIPVPVAPLAEQWRIVAKIESLSTTSKRARENLDHIPRLVEKYKQAVFSVAFRGGLTGDIREQHNRGQDGAELLATVAKRRMAVTKTYKGLTEIDVTPFEIPTTWHWAIAEDVVEPGAEIVYGIVQPGAKLLSGVPYVRGTDIEDGRIKIDQLLFTSREIAERYSRASLEGGDVLLGIIRATKVAIVPKELKGANITQGTARFRPSSAIESAYLAYWLACRTAQDWLHSKYRGIDMPGLNLRDVRLLPVPIAPIEEQKEIVRQVDYAFAKIDRLAKEATSARKLVDVLDKAVLAKAFRGELVPQDPNDEPANVLLDRIRAERAAVPNHKRKSAAK